MPGTPSDPSGVALASAQARAFIERAPPLSHEPISPETIGIRRVRTKASFAPASQRAIVRHGVSIMETAVAGIACQEVRTRREVASSLADRTILYFFGGGFALGSAFEDLPITAALADLTGARVLVPDYRLAPENPYPAALEDGMAVFRALVGASTPSPLALAGESAGGNLALAVLARARAERLPIPCAAALLSPWADLANAGDSIEANASRDPTLDPIMLAEFAAAYAAGADRHDPGISPLFGSFDEGWPPVMVTTGTRDLLMSQSVRLAHILRRSGVEIDLRIWDGLWHVFEFYDELPEAALSLAEIAAFLRDRFEAAGGAWTPARGE